MASQSESITKIEKEQLTSFRFSKKDVLTTEQERTTRLRHAQRAAILGNGYHCKVQIYFKNDVQETFEVDTTIWEADQEHITLKSGTIIPICAIARIEF